MTRQKSWKECHRFQEENDWCGISVIQMALLKVGVEKTQKEIAKDVYTRFWGVGGDIMLAYLSGFFGIVNFKNNASSSDILFHLRNEHIIIVDWYDDLDGDSPDGHYSIISKYNKKTKTITLIDPSRARKGIWEMPYSQFKDHWYDSLTQDGRIWSEGFMLWADPKSKIQ